MSEEMTLAKEIAKNFKWYRGWKIGHFARDEYEERAVRKTRFLTFDASQTGLDRF